MANAAPLLALFSGLVALIGLLGANTGILTPMAGFQTFVGGALLGGLVTVVLSLVVLVLSRGGRDPAGSKKGIAGLVAGGGLLLVVVAAASTGGDAPPINDISTNLGNPPAFASAEQVPAYAGRDMSYPAEFVPIVREAYPDLVPIGHKSRPALVFSRAKRAAEGLGWTIVYENEDAMVFDAYDETALFRFVDDVTVRVVEVGDRSLVDVRSKSRDGRGDLGANAARIRAFTEALNNL